jgi:hypothetical protein
MSLRVLFLAANPVNATQLALEQEVENIREKIQVADFGSEIEIVPHWSTKPDDLLQLFNKDDDWPIVHFSGHGTKGHELVLVDDEGHAKLVGKSALDRILDLFAEKTRVVLFNACHAEGQADVAAKHVDCAIGMSKAVGDAAAILFAASFYRALGFGKSVQDAFEQGRAAIDLEGIPEADTPQLRTRSGFDAERLRFFTGAKPYRVANEWTKLAPSPPDLGPDQKWHVFLSYRSVNRRWVLNLYDVLQQHGYRVFLDQYAVQPGNPLVERLEDGLVKSRAGVLIWSPANEDSAWCKKEHATMMQRKAQDPGFTFITLRIGGELPLMAQTDVWIDFGDYPDGPNGRGLLDLLFALGEKRLTAEAVKFAQAQHEEIKTAQKRIKAAVANGKPEALQELHDAGGVAWSSSAMLGGQAAEGLIKLECYDEALAMLESLRKDFPRSIRPEQLRALALARRGEEGDLDEAQEILAMLKADGQQDPETLGIYARTWADRHAVSRKEIHLRRSRNIYAEAFRLTPSDYYTGINAAAKSAMVGQIEKGREYAQQVVDLLAGSESKDYWEMATLPEAHMILGDYERAAKGYARAVVQHCMETGSIRSTWTQARRLRKALEIPDADWEPIAKAFEEVVGQEA